MFSRYRICLEEQAVEVTGPVAFNALGRFACDDRAAC